MTFAELVVASDVRPELGVHPEQLAAVFRVAGRASSPQLDRRSARVSLHSRHQRPAVRLSDLGVQADLPDDVIECDDVAHAEKVPFPLHLGLLLRERLHIISFRVHSPRFSRNIPVCHKSVAEFSKMI